MLPDHAHVMKLYLQHLAKQTPSLRKLVRDAVRSSNGHTDGAVRVVRRALVAREVEKRTERRRTVRLARIIAGDSIALRVVRRRRCL